MDLAENENFWANVFAYVRYFFSVLLGASSGLVMALIVGHIPLEPSVAAVAWALSSCRHFRGGASRLELSAKWLYFRVPFAGTAYVAVKPLQGLMKNPFTAGETLGAVSCQLPEETWSRASI